MKKVLITTLILSIIGIIYLALVFVFINNVTFVLKGDKDNTVLVNTEFIDEGVEAFIFNKDVSDKVEVISNLDVNKIGTYYISYNFSLLKKEYNLNRNITVVDLEGPIIKLNGDSEIILEQEDTYTELGATASDNYDKDITSNIVIDSNLDVNKVGEYEIKYSVKDSSNNESSVTRKIIVNKKKIIIKKEEEIETYDNSVIKFIKDNNYNVSVGYYNLDNNESFYYQKNKVYYGASLIKTLDAIYLYDKNMVTDEIEPYINKAISVSNNNAHHYLVNYIGRENLKQYGQSLGAINTLSGNDNYGNTTVMDQVIYLKKLYELSKNNDKLRSYFINDYVNYLELGNIDIMHKYGFYNQYHHNVGIVLDNSPYIVVILTEYGQNSNKYNIINSISKKVYEYHLS